MPLIKRKGSQAFSHNVKAEMDSGKPQDQSLAIAYSVKRRAKKMSRGGPVFSSERGQQEKAPIGSLADQVMRKRAYAEGGEVADLDEESEEQPSMMDELNMEANDKELYDDEQLSPQPRDSNEHGHELSDEDAHDMIEQIRHRMKNSGRGMMR